MNRNLKKLINTKDEKTKAILKDHYDALFIIAQLLDEQDQRITKIENHLTEEFTDFESLRPEITD